MQPNSGALGHYGNQAFQNKVLNEVVECTEIAADLQAASGNVGAQLTISPPPGRRTVKWPRNLGPAEGNYHTVYTDGNFVFDPRYRSTPIPIAEWQAEVNALNGMEIIPEILTAGP
jgi:hypothetical protein